MTTNKKTQKEMNEEIRQDKYGQDVKVGDFVCFVVSNIIEAGTIVKMNPVMMKVKDPFGYTSNRYSKDIIKCDKEGIKKALIKRKLEKMSD